MEYFGLRVNRYLFCWLLVAIVACLSCWALRGNAQSAVRPTPDPLTTEERAWLSAHPDLHLSPDPVYQPVDFFDEQGVYRGISADYIALIEQRLGFRFQVIDRSKQQQAFDAGQLRIDAMPTCAATPNRQKDWMFTTPYLEFPTYLIVRKSVSETLTLDQLSGSRVAVVGNYAAREYLAVNYPKLLLDQVPDARTGLQKVSFGLVDAFVSELPVATYWMEHEGITNLKTAGEAGYVYRLGFGMSKQFAPLHGIMEKGLAQITPEERAAIYRKWVKLPVEPSQFNRRLALVLLGGFSLAALGLLGALSWNRSLAAQVKQRTVDLQQELTERTQIEKELRISEMRFQTIFRSSPNAIAIARLSDGLILDVNDSWIQTSGFSKEALIGRQASETEIWQNTKQKELITKAIEQQKKIRDWEVEYQTKSGEKRVGIFSVETLKLNDELCVLWTVSDLTDRKRAEVALQQSEALFRSLAESTSAWVFIVQGTQIRYFNATAEVETGYTRKELAGQEIWSLIHADDHQFIKERIQARRQHLPLPSHYEARVLTKAGEVRWLQVTTTQIEYQQAIAELSTAFDITDRKRAEAALQKSEEKFRSLSETTNALVFLVQTERVYYANPATEKETGYNREELLQMDIWQLTHPDDHQLLKDRFRSREQKIPVPRVYEMRIVTKAGETRWLQATSACIEYNQAIAELSTAFDITEHKQAQDALQQSEAMFRSLTETTSAWVFIEQNNRCTYVNSAAEKGTEYSRAELATMNIWELVHPDEQRWIQERVQARKQNIPLPSSYEVRVMTRTGAMRWLQMTTRSIEYQGNFAVLGTAFDITDRKLAEEQLKISEQQLHQLAGYLQTIREEERKAMAREIHDELGQALTAMKMDLAWLTKRLPEDSSPVQERLQGMKELVSDTITTVRRLATQLRPGILDDLGLEAALEWGAQEFQTRTGIVCNFVTEAEIADLTPERATAIFRICQEALTNVARHAHASTVGIRLWEEQNHLVLEVKDNGRGITTSETAKTRSFGLLGMQERAFLLGGEFQLTSSPNKGTTVMARIPRYQSLAKGGGS